MSEDNKFIPGVMKKIGPGYVWVEDEQNPKVERKKKSSNAMLIKILIGVAIVLVLIVLFQPASSSTGSFTETFPDRERLEKNYNQNVATQLSVVTRAEAKNDKKLIVPEIEKLMILIKQDLTSKGKSSEEIGKDKLYRFCVEKRRAYR